MAWQVGEKLKDGRYTIEQVLGHSGFGQTYVAVRNTSNSERVVLKHLKKEDGEDDKTFRDRQTTFINEAMRLAGCKHPHIVKVRPETFWQGDFMHMVMEHIEGENLAILVKQRQQPFVVDEALRYIGQVASALDHIHNFDSPLIHRDVKPANIVLRSKKPEAVLVDFGSAKEVRTGATLSIKSIGSRGYSPMEIYTGQPKHTYTDVYSLAATLYFLLTATHPMSAHERASRKGDNLTPPIEHNSDIPAQVNSAIVAAMERYAEDRVQTVTEFMQRLGQPLKPSIIHQGLGLFRAKVAPSNPQVDKQIAEQAAKIAAAEKQATLERQRRQQAERESQEIKNQLQQLEAEKQRLVREQQKAESERQQRQRAERESQVAREQLQQSEAEKQSLANKLQQAKAEKERQAQAAREAQVKAEKERQAARDVQQQQKIMDYFIEEAREHLQTIEQGVLNLQDVLNDSESINELFRAALSIKGGAAMLGVGSIQHVAHRLEDFFKILKENSQIAVDERLKSLLLAGFDPLSELLDELQGGYKISDELTIKTSNRVKPVFAELESYLTYLNQLVSDTDGEISRDIFSHEQESIPQPQPVVVSQQSIFQQEITTKMRDMLQLFRATDNAESRSQLQAVCNYFQEIGNKFDLRNWTNLVTQIKNAIAQPSNSYRTLAPILIRELKEAQDLVLSNRESEIAVSLQLQNLLPSCLAELEDDEVSTIFTTIKKSLAVLFENDDIDFDAAWEDIESNETQYQQNIELRSPQGIDYSELDKLLKNQQWYEADKLTDRLMLKATGRESEGWIDLDSFKKFPCEDLQTIDRLWVHYSYELYGFSVQKQIYVECGGKLDFSYPSSETWEKFCDRTAWKSKGKWVDYPKQFFLNNFLNIKGHLPGRLIIRDGYVGLIFSRIETCEV